MPSVFGFVSLFVLTQRFAVVADLDAVPNVDCAADEEDDDTHASIALLQANISRLRSAGVQPEQESVYHFHIPKVAGSSMQTDGRRIVESSGRAFRTAENCFYNSAESELVIAMVRSPHAHVVSMFRYCIYNRNFFNHGQEGYEAQIRDGRLGTNNPTEWEEDEETMTELFTEWLQAWVGMLDAGTATGFLPQSGVRPDVGHDSFSVNCYSPVNLQTQRFQCEDRDYHPEGGLSLELAIENMRSLWMIGLQEEYETTLCLLHARVNGALPVGCSCDTREQLQVTRSNMNDPTARPVMTDEVQTLLDRLTSQDEALHEAAVERFHEDVAAVEAEFGVTILCTGDDDDDN